MKNSLSIKQRFGEFLYPVAVEGCITHSSDPKYSFRCSGKIVNRNSQGVWVQLEDKYGIIKLSRITNSWRDELFITGNPETGFLMWSVFPRSETSSSSVAFVDREKLDCPSSHFYYDDYTPPYSVENDINDYPSVEWDKIAYILKQRQNIATLYTENSECEARIVDQNKAGIFIQLERRLRDSSVSEDIPSVLDSYTFHRGGFHRGGIDLPSTVDWEDQLRSCNAGAPYAFIPSMQLDMKKYYNCKCKIKITKTILDDLAIYGTIHCLYDQEIQKRDNLKLCIEQLCKNTLILDTCVWENAEKYSDFFDMLLQEAIKQEFKITILADIYTEISNHAHSDNAEKQANARIAYRTIEKFIDAHCVSIEDAALQNDLKHTKVYADASIRKFAIESAKKGYICTILTDDRDLRIRMKGSLAKLSPDQQRPVRCFSLDEIYEQVSKSNGQNQPSNTYKKELHFSVYKELEQEIIRYSADPELCIRERSRLREIAHNYLLKRAEEVRRFPIEQQTEIIKKMKVELTSIIRTRKAGQNIHSAIQEAISRMGNNDRFHLLECDLNIIERIEFFR